MIDYSYHTHTKRCNHAFGEDEEYIQKAISLGIKELGFSDHVFLPHHSQPKIRGEYSQLDDYISSLRALREKYKDQIKIYIGFECEYYPIYEEYYRHLLDDKIVDYLILGQHCYIDEEGQFQWYFSSNTPKEKYIRYKDDVINGIKSGLFSYVAHPDLFRSSVENFDEFFVEISKDIAEAAEKYKVPLEINLGGQRYLRPYPSNEFFSIANKYKNRFIVGSDAHTPEQLERIQNTWFEDFIKKHNLKTINRLNIR